MGAGDVDVISFPRLVPHPLHAAIAGRMEQTIQVLPERSCTDTGARALFVGAAVTQRTPWRVQLGSRGFPTGSTQNRVAYAVVSCVTPAKR